jgi:hypothetical protein
MTSIRATELKNLPGSEITSRIRRAVAVGEPVLDVVNRGRPVARLALAEDKPEEWREPEPATVPLSELKQSGVSVSGLRREGRALYLSQRAGPTLALWPVERGYTRPVGELSLPEEVERLREEVNRLRREVERLRERDHSMTLLVKTAYRFFVGKPEDAGKKAGRAASETSPRQAATGEDDGSDVDP